MSILNDYMYVDLVKEEGKVVGANLKLRGSSPACRMRVMGSTMPCSVRTNDWVYFFSVLNCDVPRGVGIVDIDLLAVTVE